MKVTTGYTPIKPRVSVSELDVICTKCTKFDAAGKAIIKKVNMRYDERNERFICQCGNVVSEKVVRYYMKLDLPQYVHYEESKPVQEIVKEREEVENFVIEAINQDAPFMKRKRAVKVK